MPEVIPCPKCGQRLNLPDELIGQLVQCPTCSHQFIAATSEAAPVPPPALSSAISNVPLPPETSPLQPPDEYDDDDYYRRRRRYIRRDLEPHRAELIFGLGLASIATSLCCGLLGLILPIVTIVMANADLGAMRAGRMDPDGESRTKLGRTCAIIGLILGGAMFAIGIIINVAVVMLEQGRF